MPPLDVPAGVSETAKSHYEALAQRMTRAHQILGEMEKSVPNRGISA